MTRTLLSRYTGAVLGGAVLLVAVFGVMLMGNSTHEGAHHGCPFSIAQSMLCDSSFSHIAHFSSSLTGTAFLLLIFCVILFVRRQFLPVCIERERRRVSRTAVLAPMPLLALLYSEGILNPKAP